MGKPGGFFRTPAYLRAAPRQSAKKGGGPIRNRRLCRTSGLFRLYAADEDFLRVQRLVQHQYVGALAGGDAAQLIKQALQPAPG